MRKLALVLVLFVFSVTAFGQTQEDYKMIDQIKMIQGLTRSNTWQAGVTDVVKNFTPKQREKLCGLYDVRPVYVPANELKVSRSFKARASVDLRDEPKIKDLKTIKETEKALLVKDKNEKVSWLPKSQIEQHEDGIKMPAWLAIDKDMHLLDWTKEVTLNGKKHTYSNDSKELKFISTGMSKSPEKKRAYQQKEAKKEIKILDNYQKIKNIEKGIPSLLPKELYLKKEIKVDPDKALIETAKKAKDIVKEGIQPVKEIDKIPNKK